MQQNINSTINDWHRVSPIPVHDNETWLTYRRKVEGGWLYKTVDEFYVTDKDGRISMTDWKVTVTFVPGG